MSKVFASVQKKVYSYATIMRFKGTTFSILNTPSFKSDLQCFFLNLHLSEQKDILFFISKNISFQLWLLELGDFWFYAAKRRN